MMLLAHIEAVNKNQLELRDFLLRIIEAAQTQNADKLKALGKELENAKTRLPTEGQLEIIGLIEANFQGELDKVKLGKHIHFEASPVAGHPRKTPEDGK
jgi:hypothetical protein